MLPHLGAVGFRKFGNVGDAIQLGATAPYPAIPVTVSCRRVVARVARVRDDHVAVRVAVCRVDGDTAGVEGGAVEFLVHHSGPPGRTRADAQGARDVELHQEGGLVVGVEPHRAIRPLGGAPHRPVRQAEFLLEAALDDHVRLVQHRLEAARGVDGVSLRAVSDLPLLNGRALEVPALGHGAARGHFRDVKVLGIGGRVAPQRRGRHGVDIGKSFLRHSNEGKVALGVAGGVHVAVHCCSGVGS
mmetsp:Transcript_14405/g.33994  ORF Transcript_14405/g.33994 Transcript_14405/m.33994 type:complete len:244 (-) Transcript_14405:140-871(-)